MNNVKSRITKTVRMGGFALLTASAVLAGCKKDDDENTPAGPGTIVQVAQSNANFTALVAAVTKADLVGTLSGTTQLTVFAPTDAAFAKLAGGPLDAFSTAAKINAVTDATLINALKGVLLYHVAAGKKTSTDLVAGPLVTQKTAASSNDNTVYVSKGAAGVFVNGNSKVATPDVQASNGIIHAIDNVLLPPTQNIVQIAQGNPAFTALVAAVVKTNLGGLLSGTGDFTVFAPTNAAFDQLPDPYKTASSIQAITDQAQIDALANILKYHVIASGRVFSTDLTNGLEATTAASGASNKVTIGLSSSAATVKGKTNTAPSTITTVNLLANNGVIHAIDQVLLP